MKKGVEKVKRELTSHFVIESPCPPDETIGVGRFDSTVAAPAGVVSLREQPGQRQYDSSFAGVTSRDLASRDFRPMSARRIFASSLAADFHVHESPAFKPVIRIAQDRFVSQMTTSSLAPTNEEAIQRRRQHIIVPESLSISYESARTTDVKHSRKRHLAPRVDPLDGTDIQPVPTTAQKMLYNTYPYGHRHGKKHFFVKDHLFHDDIPLPLNVTQLPLYPQPRSELRRGVSPFQPVNQLTSLSWD